MLIIYIAVQLGMKEGGLTTAFCSRNATLVVSFHVTKRMAYLEPISLLLANKSKWQILKGTVLRV
jgi:hypothetical protein